MRLGPGFARFIADESGATAIEYALLAGMIAVIVIGIFATGGATNALYESLLAIGTAIAGE